MNLNFLTWRQWWSRPGRALLTVLSVAIAVAAVLGTTLAQDAVRGAYRAMTAALEGPPSLDIVAREGGRFPFSDAPDLSQAEGVAAIAPVMFRATAIRWAGKSVRTLAAGIADGAGNNWSRLELVAGRLPTAPREALLDAGLAARLEIVPPQRILILAGRGTAALTVVGTANSAKVRELDESVALVMPLATAHDVFGFDGQVDRVRIEIETPEQRDALAKQAATKLPPELLVQVPAGRIRLADELLRSAELALQFSGILAVAMAAFIILNTLRMNFSERRREFSILRALGASQRQIRRLLWAEAWWIGGLGAALGVPLGLVLSWGVARALQAILEARLPATNPSVAAIAAGVLIGPIVALLAAWFPARDARRLSPIAGITGIDPASADSYPRRAVVFSLLAWTGAVICLGLVVAEIVPGWLAIPGGLTMLVAYILVIPAILGPLVTGITACLPHALGAEALVADRQIQQRRTRTALTVGVLVVAISNGLGLGHAIVNNINDVKAWYRRSLAGDYVLRQLDARTLADPQQTETDIRDALAAIPGVTNSTTVRLRSARAQGEPIRCVVRDFSDGSPLPWTLPATAEPSLRQHLAQGQAVISSIVARRLDLAVGDSLRLELQGRTHSLPVAAVVNDYTFGGLAVFLDRQAAAGLFEIGPADLFLVSCQGQPAEIEPSLQSLAQQQGLLVQPFAELRHEIDQLIGGISAALLGLMVLGFVVGGFGVANTLAMSVLERTRDLGLLRIVGMTRRQIGRLVLVESLLIGLASAGLGILSGMTTALVIHLCNRALLDRDVPFQFHLHLLVINVLGCVLVAVIAAWLPGRRATRIELLSAIAYE